MLLKDIQNPRGARRGRYKLVRFQDVSVGQEGPDIINIESVYGLAASEEVEALASDRPITVMQGGINPKQGKILPQTDDDPLISQTDLYQGGISDCYLQAALIAIVEQDPRLITSLFTRIGDQDLDIQFPGYSGPSTNPIPPLKVTVQKSLFLTEEGEPLYGGKEDSYLWPAFIQKAWAVYKGSYAELPMGTPIEIMSMTMCSLISIHSMHNIRMSSSTKIKGGWFSHINPETFNTKINIALV